MTLEDKMNIELEGNFAHQVRRLAITMGLTHETVVQMGIAILAANPIATTRSESYEERPQSVSRLDAAETVKSEPLGAETLAVELQQELDSAYSPYMDAWFMLHNDELDFTKSSFWAVGQNPKPDLEYILWGQFSRFLPCKFTLRLLASAYENSDEVTLEDWQSLVCDEAPQFRDYLRNLDVEFKLRRGEQMASGFPKDTDKSKERFARHFCGDIFSNGQLVGMPAHLGFIVCEGDVIRFTPRGLDYVMAENPVMDEKEPYANFGKELGTISPQEREVLLECLRTHLPSEYRFMWNVLRWIEVGNDTPLRLSGKVEEIYGSKMDWNKDQASTYRGGAIGRLGELGLITRSWKFRSVTYQVESSWESLPHPDEVIE